MTNLSPAEILAILFPAENKIPEHVHPRFPAQAEIPFLLHGIFSDFSARLPGLKILPQFRKPARILSPVFIVLRVISNLI